MARVQHVPYENFVRLQVMLGESLEDISRTCRGVGVPCPPLDLIGRMRSDLLDSLPASCQDEAINDGLSQGFVETHIQDLQKARWPYLQCLLQFATRPTDFEQAWEYFKTPELRLRIDCLIVSRQCDPGAIAESMSGWSKYRLTRSAVEIYSYFFCNMEVMQGLAHWQQYFQAHTNESHQYFLCQAFDVQSSADLLVLSSDLSVRSAIAVSPEDTVKDLLASAYVQIKKEEKKVRQGVPAKNTSIFEWSSVFCGMFDRVRKIMEAEADESDIEIVRINLARLRERRIHSIDTYDLAKPDGPQGDVA